MPDYEGIQQLGKKKYNVLMKRFQAAHTIATADETASAFIGLGEKSIFNDWWWIGRNGKMYFTSQVHTQGGYAYSRGVVNNSLKGARIAGGVLGLLSIGFEATEVIVDEEIKPSNIINGIAGGLAVASAFVPGVGWIPLAYFGADIAVKIMTGESLTERANLEIGTVYKW